MKKLIAGKRYWFPLTIPCDGRVENGLFTGDYDCRGNAVIITKMGSVSCGWSIPPENLFDKDHKDDALLV